MCVQMHVYMSMCMYVEARGQLWMSSFLITFSFICVQYVHVYACGLVYWHMCVKAKYRYWMSSLIALSLLRQSLLFESSQGLPVQLG